MHFTNVVAAASFAASAVEAAPRGTAFNRFWARAAASKSHAERDHIRHHEQGMEENARHALHRRLHNESHTTTLQHQSQPSSRLSQLPVDDASSNGNDEEALVLDCPTASLVVSTTTIDVTVYVTEEPTPTSTPCDETTTSEVVESTSTTDCEEETPTSDWSITTLVPSDFFSEPCETTDSETTSDVISHHHSSSVTSTPTTPCETDSTPTTSPYTVTSPPTPTTTTPPATTTTPGLCIDTTIVPVTTSKLTVTVAAPPEPTRTVCIDNHETGTPADEIAYCGVPGKPAGVYFIAEFIEERSGVPVTEEGCYQFCDSVMESTKGCKSYRFYQNDLGAPRCALYGMPVSHVVDDLDENQDDKWYDLACGSPSEVTCSAISNEEPKTSTPSTTTESSTTPEPTPEPTTAEPNTPSTEPTPDVDASDINSGADDFTATNSGNNNAGSVGSGNEDSGNTDSSGNQSGNVNSGNTNSGNTNSGNKDSNVVDIDINNVHG